GTLDDLAAEVQKLVDKKVTNAAALFALVQVARGRVLEVEPHLKGLLAEWSKKPEERSPNEEPQGRPDPWPEYLQVRAALADPKLAGLGRQLARKFAARIFDASMQAHLARDVALSEAVQEGGEVASADLGLALWTSAGGEVA